MKQKPIIYINNCGEVTTKYLASHKVTLSGSYEYSHFSKGYWHEIESVEPYLPFKRILLDKPIEQTI